MQNASGNRTSVTYPSGKIVEYDYDLNGRTSQIDVNSNPLVGFTYDPLDRRELKSFASPSSLETAYTIDLAEQLQTIQNRINGGVGRKDARHEKGTGRKEAVARLGSDNFVAAEKGRLSAQTVLARLGEPIFQRQPDGCGTRS